MSVKLPCFNPLNSVIFLMSIAQIFTIILLDKSTIRNNIIGYIQTLVFLKKCYLEN